MSGKRQNGAHHRNSSPGLSLRLFLFFLKILFIYFRQRGREGEREHQCMVASSMPLMGDLACNPGMWADWKSNSQSGFAGRRSVHGATPARALPGFAGHGHNPEGASSWASLEWDDGWLVHKVG